MEHRLNGNHVELKMIRDLDAVITSHVRWMSELNRVLIFKSEPNPSMMATNAHRCCEFDEWFYGRDRSKNAMWTTKLRQIEAIHKQMHDLATGLLGGMVIQAAETDDYDRFISMAFRFKAAVRALQFKLIKEVCLVDHLTGAWNRSSLMQRLAEEYDRTVRHGESCCLCMMDLDFFKAINDRYGHGIGDQVLQGVARIAAQGLRRYDSFIRYGGEEFLFCLPKLTLQEAVAAMNRVRARIEASPIGLSGGRCVSVTASFGVAELSSVLSIEDNIEVADSALLRAKTNGRNCVCS